MSVDLSDPEITRVKGEVLDSTNPTSWFLLHYSPSATSPTLSLVSSGSDPVVPQWTEALIKLKGEGDEVAFGYGEFKGKGCVLHYLTDKIGGVKRARAVVHSRAFASLFPDYAALITISDPSQLTQELIDEKLGLNYHVRQMATDTPAPRAHEERIEPTGNSTLSRGHGDLPPTPVSQATPVAGHSNGHGLARESSPPSQSHLHPPTHVGAPGHTPSHTPGHAYHDNSSTPQRTRDVSGSGSVGETAPDRQRKVSLTARLGKAFGNPSNQTSTTSQSPSGSPGSPSGTSKFKSSFSKAFRRTSADNAPIDIRSDTPDAPPVPPKDEQSPRQPHPFANGHAPQPDASQNRIPSAGIGYLPAPIAQSPRSDSLPSDPQPLRTDGAFSPASFNHSNTATINHSSPNEVYLSPSPSAQRVFKEARMKSLTKEEEIQNRFRRELYVNDSGPSTYQADPVDDDPEEDLRLPYDLSDDHLSDHLMDKEPVSVVDEIPQALQLGRPLEGQVQDRQVTEPDQTPPTQNNDRVTDADIVDTEDEARQAEREINEGEDRLAGQHVEEGRHLEQQRREDDDRRLAEAEAARVREMEDARRKEEEERLRLREEQERQRRQAEEAERNRLLEEERLAREAEARRVQEEEEARQKQEEEEKLRIALEEQRRIEEARLREEETRRREEEERRLEAEKQEAERFRKEGIKQSLRDGKNNGGVMLRGHVTVQTTKSLIWRRRYFQLLSGEMRLFKAESDEKPIQVIHLGSQAKIEHTYEESQAQGSWKIVSDGQGGQDDFFVFADSPEEKETILEGLQIAIL